LDTGHGSVWVGSRDSAIYVVDNRDVISCTDTLFAHVDAVVVMETITNSNRLPTAVANGALKQTSYCYLDY